jgi:hypothetical protein
MSQRSNRVTAMPIGVQHNEENIRSNKGKIWKRVRAYPLDHLTTDSYVGGEGEILDARLLRDKLFHIKNTHAANGLTYKLLACIEPNLWTELVAPAALAAGVEAIIVQTDAWAYYKFQVISTVAGTPATVRAFMSGESL